VKFAQKPQMLPGTRSDLGNPHTHTFLRTSVVFSRPNLEIKKMGVSKKTVAKIQALSMKKQKLITQIIKN